MAKTSAIPSKLGQKLAKDAEDDASRATIPLPENPNLREVHTLLTAVPILEIPKLRPKLRRKVNPKLPKVNPKLPELSLKLCRTRTAECPV